MRAAAVGDSIAGSRKRQRMKTTAASPMISFWYQKPAFLSGRRNAKPKQHQFSVPGDEARQCRRVPHHQRSVSSIFQNPCTPAHNKIRDAASQHVDRAPRYSAAAHFIARLSAIRKLEDPQR